MSYNFDPDKWYEVQKLFIESRRTSGAIDKATSERLLEELERRYEDIVRRLDNTFQFPK